MSPSKNKTKSAAPLSRSEQMSRIRGQNTKPEIRLRTHLYRLGFRYRINLPLHGTRPDLTITSSNLAVFVDGCQWHGCPDHYVRPRTRSEFWSRKLTENVLRDRRQTVHLLSLGWQVLRFWEHEVDANIDNVVAAIVLHSKREALPTASWWRVISVDVINQDTDLERRHEIDLIDTTRERDVVRHRTTTKWRRVRVSP